MMEEADNVKDVQFFEEKEEVAKLIQLLLAGTKEYAADDPAAKDGGVRDFGAWWKTGGSSAQPAQMLEVKGGLGVGVGGEADPVLQRLHDILHKYQEQPELLGPRCVSVSTGCIAPQRRRQPAAPCSF